MHGIQTASPLINSHLCHPPAHKSIDLSLFLDASMLLIAYRSLGGCYRQEERWVQAEAAADLVLQILVDDMACTALGLAVSVLRRLQGSRRSVGLKEEYERAV